MIISGNPEFRALASSRVAREYERLVVQERGARHCRQSAGGVLSWTE